MKLFNLETPILQTLTRIALLMWMCCLFALACLPIVSAGAASAALYRMAFRIKRDGEATAGAFFRAMQEDFKIASCVWGAILVLGLLLYLGLRAAFLMGDSPGKLLLLALLGALALLTGLLAIYGFALTAYFKNTAVNTIKNAFLIGLHHLRESIYCLAIAAVPILALLVSPWWFLRFLYFWVLLYPAFAAYWIAWILRGVFQAYEPKSGDAE